MSHGAVLPPSGFSLKLAKSLKIIRGPGLAIASAVIVCAQTACLVPQSVDPIVEVAHPPPHFVLDSIRKELLPPVLQLYRQGSADAALTPPCHCELELNIPLIEEDDPTVSLEVRWFVDYDTSVPATVRPWQPTPLPGSFDNPGTVRTLQTPFEFDPDTFGINTSGFHTVDVLVGETAGFDDTATTRPFQTMKAGYEADKYRFFINVNVQEDASRPSCPSAFPSVRVCR